MTDRVESGGRMRCALLTITLLLATTASARGKLPPLEAIVAVCRDAKFTDAVCNPAPTLAPLIGIPEARVGNGNTGSLWVTVVGISFTSALNEERFLLRYEEITGICADHTTVEVPRGDRRFTTAVRQRHYFRITTRDRDVVFWVPGGTSTTNGPALFYHAVLNQILPVNDCDLRSTE